MSWLERIDEREARRVAKAIAAGAMQTRDLAEDHLTHFAKQARAIAEPRWHDAADFVRHEGTAAAKAAAHQARAIAEPRLHEAADFIRHEGTAVARAAAHQAARASRAVRADPIPTIVGVVGLALLASLVLGRRRT